MKEKFNVYMVIAMMFVIGGLIAIAVGGEFNIVCGVLFVVVGIIATIINVINKKD